MSLSERLNELVSNTRERRRGTVILVEDDEASRRGYGLILRHYGFQVEDARTGAEAIELMRRKRPDLVLMDIGLPVMDGWQASRIIKEDASLSDVPLIAFSGRVDCVADLQARSSFDGFIRKPISPAAFARRVDAYIELASRSKPLTKSMGSDTIDFASA